MKKINLIFISLIFLLIAPSCKGEVFPVKASVSDTLRIATYNIRIKIAADTDEKSWSARKAHVAGLIHAQSWDVFGMQEIINHVQENDLREMLPGYEIFSKGRDDDEGKTGERLAIFFHKQRFEMMESGFFFLSETPEIASKGWDAALNRICLWVKLKDKILNREFYFYNAHFDHMGIEARAQSASLIMSKIQKINAEIPVFFVGDLNASPYETTVYQKITPFLYDSKKSAEIVMPGSEGTFNNWGTGTSYPENLRIDYVFTRGITVLSYQVIQKRFTENGVYPSDHFPVEIKCVIQ
jgi:endonuclease/exonuclease/phosphatase family metal-dependent hydrolase